ncbi:MAG: methionine ABC transporter substrate-binding protein, partial [Xanthomonadaceae bacterium]|nr:methionine ABC transporter substrate-binding protein [Xanthomonadaceae bacterium]
ADALVIENQQSPYVNYLVGRPDNQDDPRVKMLAAALTSADNRNFIEQKYRGAVFPAFSP